MKNWHTQRNMEGHLRGGPQRSHLYKQSQNTLSVEDLPAPSRDRTSAITRTRGNANDIARPQGVNAELPSKLILKRIFEH